MDIKKVLKYLEVIKELVEKVSIKGDTETETNPLTNVKKIVKIDPNSYFTTKVKLRLLKEIEKALKADEKVLEDKEAEFSFAATIDNIVQILKTAKADLKDEKVLLAANKKLDDATHTWVRETYGVGNQGTERTKDDDVATIEKDAAKAAKEKEEEKYKKSKESVYMKLLERMAKVSEAMSDIFTSKTYREKTDGSEKESKEDDKKKLDMNETLLKRIKRDLSDEMTTEEIKKVADTVLKLKAANEKTIFADAIDGISKHIIKYVGSIVPETLKEEELLTEAKAKGKLIRVSYETWDEEALEAGETDDKGWENEEGTDFSKDVDETPAKDAAKYLKEEGATNPSNGSFSKGTYYSDDGDKDIKSGDTTIKSYHLAGEWTEDEEKEIFNIITKKKNISEQYYNQANWLL